ncbi:hypothetical protein K523DRAFT_369146 [Schizophyllum commune Tattone D]|nr:hypothetical protein K523DRAFT_369146 [Schizophyllum commune Tattone D]
MHKVLEIPEILCIICSFADRPWRKGDVLRLALTCRYFLEPALDVLWREAHNLGHFLKCFPSDVWVDEKREGLYNNGTVLKLIRCPTRQDWARPLYYAKRIKDLKLSNYIDMDAVAPTSYSTLAISCPRNNPFRRLQCLRLSRYRREDASMMFFYRLLLCAPIRRLELCFPKWENTVQAMSLVTMATSRCTPTDVDLSCANFHDGAVEHIVSEWPQLQRIVLGTASTKTIRQLADLPALRVLKVAHGIRRDLPDDGEGLDAFPALQRLVVRDSTIEACTWLLTLLDYSPVKKLHMHFSTTASAAEWQKLIEQLADAVDSRTLERLVLFDDTSARDITRDSVTSAMVEPLLCFRELVHLTIRPRRPVHLDGAMMLDMGKALAHLRYLDMRGRHSVYGSPTLNMHDLVAFALQCPTLETVGLSVNTLGHAEDGRCSQSVTKIMVGDAILEPKDLIVFASYLSFVFPNLYNIETLSGLFGETFFNWKRVEELLPLCRTVRQQGYMHGLRGVTAQIQAESRSEDGVRLGEGVG